MNSTIGLLVAMDENHNIHEFKNKIESPFDEYDIRESLEWDKKTILTDGNFGTLQPTVKKQ